jgi:hypothetical protein
MSQSCYTLTINSKLFTPTPNTFRFQAKERKLLSASFDFPVTTEANSDVYFMLTTYKFLVEVSVYDVPSNGILFNGNGVVKSTAYYEQAGYGFVRFGMTFDS